ncbi:hypothetical protein Bca52824_029644 [Brassica carinata]|uniref:Uncharacterized protein n=1 Tax=Brassica carinata TaxID=52824 RepID=A0A8X7VEQ7_BRACI|nr:hypothetical protein Bca52824_029644 [Brassica carinata]
MENGILKMFQVEPYLHLTPLLGLEDLAALIETITEAVIESAERYMNLFSNSRIPYHLVNWVISQVAVIRDVDALLNSTPASFIERLVSLDEQGLKVFGCDHSKNYAKTVIHWSITDLSLDVTLLKQQEEKYISVSKSSISINNNTRKRKEERPDVEGETEMKLFKHRHNKFEEKSRLQPFVFSDCLVNGTEVRVSDMKL